MRGDLSSLPRTMVSGGSPMYRHKRPESRLPEHLPKSRTEGRPPLELARPYIEEALTQMKRGRLHVRSRSQAISIGVLRARRAGIAIEAGTTGLRPMRGGTT